SHPSKEQQSLANSSLHPSSAMAVSHATSQKLEVAMALHNQIRSAVFSGDVHLRTEGLQPTESTAGQAVLSFKGRNVLTKIHADQQVKLMQHQGSGAKAQDVAVAAPAIDMLIAGGSRLSRAETTGPPEITL